MLGQNKSLRKLRKLCTDVGLRSKQKISFLTSPPTFATGAHNASTLLRFVMIISKPVPRSDSSLRSISRCWIQRIVLLKTSRTWGKEHGVLNQSDFKRIKRGVRQGWVRVGGETDSFKVFFKFVFSLSTFLLMDGQDQGFKFRTP